MMASDKFGIEEVKVKIECIDFNKSFQIDAVKNEQCEIDMVTCRSYGISDTDFVDHKHATDIYQEQNGEKLGAKNLSPKDGYSKFFENSSNSCNSEIIKNDIDIFYEDLKRESSEEISREHIKFCEVGYQSIGMETDSLKSTNYISECNCQKQNEPLYSNILGQDMATDVKPSTLDSTTDLGLKALVQDEIIPGGEGAKKEDSSAIPQMLSVPPMKNDKEMKSELCSEPLQNNLFVAEKKVQCQKFSLKDHVEDHNREKIFCKVCSKSFARKYNLKVHMRIHSGKKLFHCNICSRSFSRKYHLKGHMRIHTGDKPFHCKVCSKTFSLKGYLKMHEKTHTGEKPYQCKICPKSFGKLDTLKDHERTHTGEKPFNCKICSKSFSRKCNLKVHQRSHTGEKPYQCKICSKSFSQFDPLKDHERSHTGENPFNCKICSKSFSRKCNLKVHQKSHTDEKPFYCKICSKFFRHAVSLKIHEKGHTDKTPFQCKICSKYFSRMSHIKTHVTSHTGEK